MAILNFGKPATQRGGSENLANLLDGFSIEVMPRTAAKVDDFRAILPPGTRVYIAHIEGTPIEEMVETARRIGEQGFSVMPHMPARIMTDLAEFEDWLKRYAGEAGVSEALVLGGGPTRPLGSLDSSMALLDSGLFDKHGFTRLHVAGHPEGSKDIDPDGGTRLVDEAAQWKQAYSERTDAAMTIVTQFAFDAGPVVDWAERLAAAGVTLPIRVGVAGPAKLQTLIKFAISCGVGPSLSVLQKRAKDLSKLVRPFEPTEVLSDLAGLLAQGRGGHIEGVHIFPLGGIVKAAEYSGDILGGVPSSAAASGG